MTMEMTPIDPAPLVERIARVQDDEDWQPHVAKARGILEALQRPVPAAALAISELGQGRLGLLFSPPHYGSYDLCDVDRRNRVGARQMIHNRETVDLIRAYHDRRQILLRYSRGEISAWKAAYLIGGASTHDIHVLMPAQVAWRSARQFSSYTSCAYILRHAITTHHLQGHEAA